MRRILLMTALALTACSPIPHHYVCEMPLFELRPPHQIRETIGTASYFSDECPSELPKEFTLVGTSGIKIEAKVLGNRLLLTPPPDTQVMALRGPGMFKTTPAVYYAVDLNLKKDRSYAFEILGKKDTVLETITLFFERSECTCAGYDAV